MTDSIIGGKLGGETIKSGELTPPEFIPTEDKVKEVTDPDYELKKKVIEELEKAEVTTLSGVATRLGVSKLKLWALKRKDMDFAEQINEAAEALADRLEEELLTCEKMPQIVARLARLKTIRPAYRDSFKVVVGSPKVEALLEEMKQAGKTPSPRELKEASEVQSLLVQGEISAQ